MSSKLPIAFSLGGLLLFLACPAKPQDELEEEESGQATEQPSAAGDSDDMMSEDQAGEEKAETTPSEKKPELPAPEKNQEEKVEAPVEAWPFQQALFALYAPVKTSVVLGMGYATNPDVDSLAFHLTASYSFLNMAILLRVPVGLAMQDDLGNQFNYGDMELGWKWLLIHEKEKERHLAVGLTLIGPLSRVGEEKNLKAVQSGQLPDESNFGKRYLLAQKPLLEMGLIPKLNFGVVPYVAFGQNLGRVSLQTDLGCLLMVMDNVDTSIYGTNRRVGAVLFYDLAAPVAVTKELSLVAEFNAAVALDGLTGTGFALTLGPRWTQSGFSAGAGVQIPLGVDNKPPDDDKMIGRFDTALVARHQWAVIVDLSYSF